MTAVSQLAHTETSVPKAQTSGSHSKPTTLPLKFPLLVTIAGDDCTTSTVQFAEVLATECGATPTLLYVMELMPVATLDGGIGTAVLTQILLDPAERARNEQALRATYHLNTGAPATWPMTIELGNVASSIVMHAQRTHAELIIMGLHRHGTVDRVLGEDTMRMVIGLGGGPVLGLRPSLTSLPKSIVVATDFSRASVRAARLARRLLAPGGTMYLTFVAATEHSESESAEGRKIIEINGVDMAFNQLRMLLDPAPDMRIVPVKREGNTIDELRSVCDAIKPDLVSVGSQRHSIAERLFMGSVAKAMANDGRWSVLVTPPLMAYSR
jgi:nucleotide-binding universal stress UspA family protein